MRSDLPLNLSLQFVGAEFQDYSTIEFSRLMAQEFGGFIPHHDIVSTGFDSSHSEKCALIRRFP
jgi:hypothetical protein